MLFAIIRYLTATKYWIIVYEHTGCLVVKTSTFKPRSNKYVTFVDGPFYTHERLEAAFEFWQNTNNPRKTDNGMDGPEGEESCQRRDIY